MVQAAITWILIVLLLIPAINVRAWPIPDTGQTKCYNDTIEISCPAPGEAFYGQDGNYSISPPSYTKLDAAGKILPDSGRVRPMTTVPYTWRALLPGAIGRMWGIWEHAAPEAAPQRRIQTPLSRH